MIKTLVSPQEPLLLFNKQWLDSERDVDMPKTKTTVQGIIKRGWKHKKWPDNIKD